MDEPLRPQRPTVANADVLSVEWLFEPCWPGDRLLARVREQRLSLIGADGQPADDDFPEAREVLATAIVADDAVVDGIWTAQPFIGDGSPARAWAETLEREGLDADVPDPLETEQRRAFVAVDLVELDGEELHEIPFQERRRVLESVIDESIRVRLSPVVKQPISGWLIGWRANGFSRYLAKHQNSRYRPGEISPDWLEIPISLEPTRGFAARMLGQRERRRRVTDSD